MGGNLVLTSAFSLLLDVLPVAALIALAAAFVRGRHRCLEEERELRESIEVFRTESGKTESSIEKGDEIDG